jgi:hypothetical protein
MKTSTLKNKLIGILGIIFGLACLSPLFAVEKSKLIMQTSEFFLVKYYVIIVSINGGLGFIIFGILIYLGILIPYYFIGRNDYEKAKHDLLGVIFSVPFLTSTTSVVFVMSRTHLFKILWIFVLMYIAWIFFSTLRILKAGSRSNH